VEYASEFRYQKPVFTDKDVLIMPFLQFRKEPADTYGGIIAKEKELFSIFGLCKMWWVFHCKGNRCRGIYPYAGFPGIDSRLQPRAFYDTNYKY